MSDGSKDIKKVMTEQPQTEQSQTSSYRSIFKATSLFGGVQVYNILISIIKSKFVALLLGPTGVGILGLYQSATQLIRSISSLGLSQSAVRNVSEANATGDKHRVSLVVTILRRLVWITGLLGMVLVMVLSPVLSQTTFGNKDYVFPLIILSVTLLIDQLSAGQNVLLQGLRRLKDLAKASALGATVSLLVTVPIYYLFGIKGIVPTLILNSSITFFFSWYFSRRIRIEKVRVDSQTVLKEGKNMLQMGVAMSISGILVYISSYVLRSFIRMEGGVDAVGLFTAGFTIMTSYAGLVFNAMSTDYYPRLASVNEDNEKCRLIMNQQAEIGVLIIAPLMTFCVVFIPLVVQILYSEKFLGANSYIIWCALGMLFKMASWSVAFVFVAKGESKLFIINETISNIYVLGIYLLGYHLRGLEGLGVANMVGYLIYTLQVYIIARFRYNFSFSSLFIKVFLMHLVLVASCVGIVYFAPSDLFKYVIGSLIIILSLLMSLRGLDKRISLFDYINKFIHRND